MNSDRIRPGSLATINNCRAQPRLILRVSRNLLEEGNTFEADAVAGVENAKDPDVSEVTTRQVPEDDIPEEYLNDDERIA